MAIVTGAPQGVGAVYARALAAEGAKVVVSDILDGHGVVDAICLAGGDAMFVEADVSDEAAVLLSRTYLSFVSGAS